MSLARIELLLPDAFATEILGVELARAYRSLGQPSAVLHLHGDLGAGKTTCVRSLLRTLGVDDVIRSPTYTLVETYELPSLTCVHVDLYRVQGPAEVDELGLHDLLDANSLLLVEWPAKGGAALPPADLEFTLRYHDTGRVLTAAAGTSLGQTWLDKLVHDNSLTSYVSNLT